MNDPLDAIIARDSQVPAGAGTGGPDPLDTIIARDSQVPAPVKKTPTMSWGDATLNAFGNIPSSAGNFFGGLYNAVAHPINTATNLATLVRGGMENAAYDLTKLNADQQAKYGQPVDPADARVLAYGNTPQMDKADAVGQFFKDRYGGVENIKQTIANDPVGVLSDASAVATGGGGLVAKTARALDLADAAAAADKVVKVGNAVNPINVAIAGAKGVGKVAQQGLGLSTGVGPETIGAAYDAGKNGQTAFMDNLTGKVKMTDVLDQARAALAQMRQDRLAQYRQGIASTAADTTKLDFTPIDDAVKGVVDSMKAGDHWKIGSAEASKVQEVQDIVNEWRNDPSMHTAMGLDALKQRLDAIYPDSPMQNQAQRAITTVRNAVKNTIVKQSPEYASTMSDYENAIGLEQEITRALSLGDKASADTALRKLQSLTRNNVQANYGFRLKLAKVLQDQGGQDIMPAVSGQAMNTWIARGLTGKMGESATIGAAGWLHNPYLLGALPLQSPKIVGAGLYGMGRARGILGDITGKTKLTPEQAALAVNLLSQGGRDSAAGQ